MAASAFLRNATFLLIVLVIVVLSTDDTDVTTSYTTITIEPRAPLSTLTTVTSALRDISPEAPTEEPESTESEPPYEAESGPGTGEPDSTESEPEYMAEPSLGTEEPESFESKPSYAAESILGGRPIPGPHHITMSIPLPHLPSAVPQPAIPQPTGQQSAAQTPYQGPAPTADNRPPSTTWRYDPVPGSQRTARPCNELSEMAFAKYKHTMELCRKAAAGGPEETRRLLTKLRGYNFLLFCKVPPPASCCLDVQEMIHAQRCFTWWPSPVNPNYYEPPADLKSLLGSWGQ